MADDTVCRFHVTHLGWAVVAFGAVGVSQTCMEVGGQVALLAGVGVMREGLDGGGRGRPSAALDVAGEALSTEVGIMTFYQITRTGARLWMADDAVGRFHVTHLGWAVVAFSAVGVSQARMEIGGQVALLTGVGVVRVSLEYGSVTTPTKQRYSISNGIYDEGDQPNCNSHDV